MSVFILSLCKKGNTKVEINCQICHPVKVPVISSSLNWWGALSVKSPSLVKSLWDYRNFHCARNLTFNFNFSVPCRVKTVVRPRIFFISDLELQPKNLLKQFTFSPCLSIWNVLKFGSYKIKQVYGGHKPHKVFVLRET